MGEEGFALGAHVKSETALDARERTESRTLDPDLARLVEAWEGLPDVRRQIILRVLQGHQQAARSDAEPTQPPAPWVARLREAKDLGQFGTADAALFETPDGQHEAIGLDAATLADVAGLELLGEGEPLRAVCPGERLSELLQRLTALGQTVVVVDCMGEADRAAGRLHSRRVCRPTDPDAEPDHATEPEGGWSHGDTAPALTLIKP